MIVPVMAISNLVLTQQIYSEEINGAHAYYRKPVPLINSLRMWLPTVKQVWLADDSAGAGRIGTIISAKKGKVWLSCQRSKNLVIKFQELATEAQQVFRDEVNISTRGTSKRLLRRLGALTWVRELQRSVLQRKKS